MKHLAITLFLTSTVLAGSIAMATEEAKYDVLRADGAFELRRYAPKIVAQTIVNGDFSEVGNKGFRRLAGYIFGDNETTKKIAMTAPVNLAAANDNMATTAPVNRASINEKVNAEHSVKNWRMTFTMPSSFTAKTLPEPNNEQVVLREEPAIVMATVRYSGTWSQSRYQEHEKKLRAWIEDNGLKITGAPVFARYNSPFTLWLLRRNEVLIPVQYPR